MVWVVQLDQHAICVVSSGRQWLQSVCLVCRSNPGESSYPQHGQPASGLFQKQTGVHPWHQSRQEAAGSSGAMSDVDSTEVVYKIRQWSLPGAAVVPVLNVSSRVFWLLDVLPGLSRCR